MIFSFKIYNYTSTAINLKKQLVNTSLEKGYELRNQNNLSLTSNYPFNNYTDNTFHFFFTNFINKYCMNLMCLSENHYNKFVDNNINIIFLKFINNFPKFDIKYKYVNA
jgi:hypothetical protein